MLLKPDREGKGEEKSFNEFDRRQTRKPMNRTAPEERQKKEPKGEKPRTRQTRGSSVLVTSYVRRERKDTKRKRPRRSRKKREGRRCDVYREKNGKHPPPQITPNSHHVLVASIVFCFHVLTEALLQTQIELVNKEEKKEKQATKRKKESDYNHVELMEQKKKKHKSDIIWQKPVSEKKKKCCTNGHSPRCPR